MIRSMTGFGAGNYQGENFRLHIEVKSVNHRYGSVDIHLPSLLNPLEESLRKQVAARLTRGKTDVFISLNEHIPRNKKIKVDKELAIAYYGALKEISQILDLPLPLSAEYIAKYQDVLSLEEDAPDAALFGDALTAALETALEQLTEMRLREGKHLYDDVTARIRLLAEYVGEVEKLQPQAAALYRSQLSDKMKEFLGGAAEDQARLLQEVLIFSEKADATEEIVRLKSHLRQFQTALERGGPIGRKLDFIVQEMNREANTIAAKASDARILEITVEIKSEIEKIREQIQNIE